jgi:hypothetical protein
MRELPQAAEPYQVLIAPPGFRQIPAIFGFNISRA